VEAAVSRPAVALMALVLALMAGGAGYWRGHADGRAVEQGRQNADAVQRLSQALEAHGGLIDSANAASAGLRAAMAARTAEDRMFSKEFRDALTQSAADRAGCQFDAGIVRQLAAARDRAAQAAAGGGAATVPQSGAGAGR